MGDDQFVAAKQLFNNLHDHEKLDHKGLSDFLEDKGYVSHSSSYLLFLSNIRLEWQRQILPVYCKG